MISKLLKKLKDMFKFKPISDVISEEFGLKNDQCEKISPKKEIYEFTNAEYDEWIEEIQLKCQPELNDNTKHMMSLFCPHMDRNCSGCSCVHYVLGYIRFRNGSSYFQIKPSFKVIKPSCKLWVVK